MKNLSLLLIAVLCFLDISQQIWPRIAPVEVSLSVLDANIERVERPRPAKDLTGMLTFTAIGLGSGKKAEAEKQQSDYRTYRSGEKNWQLQAIVADFSAGRAFTALVAESDSKSPSAKLLRVRKGQTVADLNVLDVSADALVLQGLKERYTLRLFRSAEDISAVARALAQEQEAARSAVQKSN